MAGIYKCVTSLQDYFTQVLGRELRSLCLEGRDATDRTVSQAPFLVIVLNFRFYIKENVFYIDYIQGSFIHRVFRCWEAKVHCLLFIPLSVGPPLSQRRENSVTSSDLNISKLKSLLKRLTSFPEGHLRMASATLMMDSLPWKYDGMKHFLPPECVLLSWCL